MTPDFEELIKRVNTLTLDKNRLRQKLTQLCHNGNQREPSITSLNHVSPASTNSLPSNNLQRQSSSESGCDTIVSKTSQINNNYKSSSNGTNESKLNLNSIAGVECSTSCEDDLLFMNELYRKRLEEYNENWDHIQSKCTALLSELNALQKHYALLKKEKLDLEEKYKISCDECENTKSELQTIVLNYETQLSAMSEHLSMITSQVNLGDSFERIQQ